MAIKKFFCVMQNNSNLKVLHNFKTFCVQEKFVPIEQPPQCSMVTRSIPDGKVKVQINKLASDYFREPVNLI